MIVMDQDYASPGQDYAKVQDIKQQVNKHYMVLNVLRKGEKGVQRWGRDRLYTYRYTVTTYIRWAAVSTDHNFAKADLNHGPSAYQPNNFPLGYQTIHVSALYATEIFWSSASENFNIKQSCKETED